MTDTLIEPDREQRSSETTDPDPDSTRGFNQLLAQVLGYRTAKILFVGNDLGIFDLLAAGDLSSNEIADGLACDRRGMRILLDALVSMTLLEKIEGTYRNSDMASRFLVKGRPDYKGQNLAYQNRIWEFWSGLEEVVRRGRPRRVLGELLAGDPPFTRSYILGMDDIARPFAEAVMDRLEVGPEARFLDVGGGPGTFSRAFIKRFPGAKATIIDLPSTLQITAELLQDWPDAHRIRLLAQDYKTTEFPGNRDVVLMSHITHDESPPINRDLIERAYRALKPGGLLLIHDFTVDRDRTAPVFGALFSVNMLVYTEGGETYSVEDYHGWMTEIGFQGIVAVPILKDVVGNPTTLVKAWKPSC